MFIDGSGPILFSTEIIHNLFLISFLDTHDSGSYLSATLPLSAHQDMSIDASRDRNDLNDLHFLYLYISENKLLLGVFFGELLYQLARRLVMLLES